MRPCDSRDRGSDRRVRVPARVNDSWPALPVTPTARVVWIAEAENANRDGRDVDVGVGVETDEVEVPP